MRRICRLNILEKTAFPGPKWTFFASIHLSFEPRASALTHQFVLTTLRCCPSDLAALSFFLWCAQQPHYFHDKPTSQHMITVVSNLTRTYGTIKGIIHALDSVGCVIKAQTLLLLMRIYWRGCMYDMVFGAFDEMMSHGYVPNTYARNIVMDVLFKIKQVDLALRVLEETQSPNFLSFSIAVCNLCRVNDLNNVKKVVRLMLMKGYYMNLETYILIMNCLRNLLRIEESLQLLGMMIVLGAPISSNIWSILIDCVCKSGRVKFATFLLEKMVGIGFSPIMAACTSLIKGCLESHMPIKAFEILGILESKGCAPDLVLCNVLIDCLSKMGWFQQALLVFSGLRERRLTPDVYTYSSLVTAVCLSRQYVLLPLLTSGVQIQPDLVVCNNLLSYFCKAYYPEGAVEFYKEMTERGFIPDKYSFAGVLTALCGLGRMQQAVNVYNGIILSNSDIDAHVHTIMLNGLVKAGCYREAVRLYRRAVAEKFPLDAVSYNVVIGSFVKGGMIEEAYGLFDKMKKMDGIELSQHVYNLILLGLCKNRDVEMAKHVMKEMVDRDVKLDPRTSKMFERSFPENIFA